MNLAIIGHGKMGCLIEQLAPEYGFTVTQRLNSTNNRDATGITGNKFAGIDVAVDFSTADAAPHNIARLAALQINTIVGTTGWTQHLLQVQARVRDSGIGLVWSPNYSVGVNIFLRLASEASRRIASYKEYGAWAWEIHHSTKKDAPSGTLVKLVDEMREAGYERRVDIASNRAGAIPGTHEIGFDSPADTITLRHTARSREGFALGAIKAAEWVKGKSGFHAFGDILFT